jgi:cell division protein FtsL
MNRINAIFIILFFAFVVHFISASLIIRGTSESANLRSSLSAARNYNETLKKENNDLTSRDRIIHIAENELGMQKSEFLSDNIDFVLLEETRQGWAVEFLGTITTDVIAAERK